MPFVISDSGSIPGHQSPVLRATLQNKVRRAMTGTTEVLDDAPAPVGTGDGSIFFDVVDAAEVPQTWTITYRIGTNDWEVVGSVTGALTTLAVSDTTYNNLGTAEPVSFLITTGATPWVNNDSFTITAVANVIDNTNANRWVLSEYNFDTKTYVIERLADSSQAIRMTNILQANRDTFFLGFEFAINYAGPATGDFGNGISHYGLHIVWPHNMRYYIVFNDRRLILVTEFAGKYFTTHIGLFLPFGTVGQYPNPVYLGSSTLGTQFVNWKFHDNVASPGGAVPMIASDWGLPKQGRVGSPWNNRYQAVLTDELDARQIVQGYPNIMSEPLQTNTGGFRDHTQVFGPQQRPYSVWPWDGIRNSAAGDDMTRSSVDQLTAVNVGGSQTFMRYTEKLLGGDGFYLLPGIIFRETSAGIGIGSITGDVYGQLDGVYWVSGNENYPENRGTFNGMDYVCFPDPARPGAQGGWWALRLE